MRIFTRTSSLLFVVCMASQAWAARYLVMFQDKSVFRQTHLQLSLNNSSLQSVQIQKNGTLQKPFAHVREMSVEQSLPALNSLVVESEDEKSVEALASGMGVAFVEKEVFHPAPKPVNGFKLTQPWDFHAKSVVLDQARVDANVHSPWGIAAVRAPEAWSASSAGQNSRVLVLDTGIDRDHPTLKANFEQGRDFMADGNQPYDYADHVGHGTHVSGTIAAVPGQDGFVGVAPRAKILMGRVCSEEGCSSIGVTMGIMWGIEQKVDVISMSLGGPYATTAEKRAVEAAERAGIVIVAASGNDGKPEVSYPAALPTVVAVGALNDKLDKARFSNWGPELKVSAPGVGVISSVPMGSGRESQVTITRGGNARVVRSSSFQGAPDVTSPMAREIVFAQLGRTQDYLTAKVTGKFALVQRGEINFGEKVKNAVAAGAAGLVIFNNEPGLLQGALTQDGSTVAIPVFMIEQTTGEELKAAVTAGQRVQVEVQTVSSDFASFDGTSMACPHVTGVVALIKSANKSLTPAQVREILTSTARSLTTANDQNQVGAGLVDAAAAVQRARR